MIAALYVQRGGVYYGIDGVEPWGLPERDAREYAGPWPVVAHPPCSSWCRLAALTEARYGHKRGVDGGCFKAALAAVRTFGGVLEHPAWSDAWAAFDLPVPERCGAWTGGICGGFSAHVEQVHYGHRARKQTWLYAFGARDLPTLIRESDNKPIAVVSFTKNHSSLADFRRRLTKRQASATPPRFRDLLISIAESVPFSLDSESSDDAFPRSGPGDVTPGGYASDPAKK